ncbi:MAG: NAD(P)-dependent oxidoreductase [Vicinamibacteria bacterium]|nr:NAD(P)-dependent oxidoreductase [Vicinamibacteria bacterium]
MRVLITGGAGYVGSMLAGVLLQHGHAVTVLDRLLFGGESLLGYWTHPEFRFSAADVTVDPLAPHMDGVDAVVHLSAIVGFPACQAVGRKIAWLYNVDGTRRVFEAAESAGVNRFVFASTYSNYGLSPDGAPVSEASPLNPQSLYAETKIAAEKLLVDAAKTSRCSPMIYRFATLFGVSPRTRFDLIVNQFVLEAVQKRRLIIYQRGYSRSFVHVRDVVRGIEIALMAPEKEVRGQIFNLGGDGGNHTKDQIAALVQRHVPGTRVDHQDLTFGGDMRDIAVSFAKARRELDFEPAVSVEQGVIEIRDALLSGVIKEPMDSRYRNARFIVP